MTAFSHDETLTKKFPRMNFYTKWITDYFHLQKFKACSDQSKGNTDRTGGHVSSSMHLD